MRTPKRKSTRFVPEGASTASVAGKPALVLSESYKGCGLVMTKSTAPREGEEVRAKVGDVSALRGVVRWTKDLGDAVVIIGIEFLE